MKENFDLIMSHVLISEGGWQNDPNDRGNWTGGKKGAGVLKGTKYGISAMSYPNEDIENLTWERAKRLYKRDFWDTANCDELPHGLDYSVVDFNINSGVSRSVKKLQECLGFTGKDVDGIVGANTLTAIQRQDNFGYYGLIEEHNDKRLSFLKSLKKWSRFGGGWASRVSHVKQGSLDLADGKMDGVISMPEISPVAPEKANGNIKSVGAICKPEALYGGISAVSGLMGAVSDNPVLSWAAAIVLVAGAGVAGYYFYNRMQDE